MKTTTKILLASLGLAVVGVALYDPIRGVIVGAILIAMLGLFGAYRLALLCLVVLRKGVDKIPAALDTDFDKFREELKAKREKAVETRGGFKSPPDTRDLSDRPPATCLGDAHVWELDPRHLSRTCTFCGRKEAAGLGEQWKEVP